MTSIPLDEDAVDPELDIEIEEEELLATPHIEEEVEEEPDEDDDEVEEDSYDDEE